VVAWRSDYATVARTGLGRATATAKDPLLAHQDTTRYDEPDWARFCKGVGREQKESVERDLPQKLADEIADVEVESSEDGIDRN